jgi:hypothetical protein
MVAARFADERRHRDAVARALVNVQRLQHRPGEPAWLLKRLIRLQHDRFVARQDNAMRIPVGVQDELDAQSASVTG